MKTSTIILSSTVGILVCAMTLVGGVCCGQSVAPDAAAQEASQQPAATAQETSDSKATEESPASTEDADPFPVKVADDSIIFTAAGPWKSITPRSRMLEAELKIPKVGDDPQDGRLTIMGAGGTIEANIVRWKGQYIQPDGSDTSDKTKVEIKTIADQKVHFVDIVGTYLDSPGGPMAGGPKVELANYRMLAAIIETEEYGNYFVKFYGPKTTIDQNEDAFKAMIKSLKIAD
jgi:hypothetical protein